jgi:transitional endoplasmic reticulum ATPase
MLSYRKSSRKGDIMPIQHRRRHGFKGNVIINAINVKHDKNECFVFNKCILYLHRHLKRNFTLDRETMEILCWVLGNEMEQIGGYLLDFIDYDRRREIEEEFLECGTNHDEYAYALINMLKKIGSYQMNKFQRFIFRLLEQREKNLKYRGTSGIEKNIANLKKMFKLTYQEIELCTFLFIISTYDNPESFFDGHLSCTKFSGRKYLINILGLSHSKINEVFSGTLQRFELLEINKYNIELNDEFICMFQDTSDRIFSKYFYSRTPHNTIPLEYHFADQKQIQHIFQLLKEKPKTSTHILLYGSQGTGKTSFADGLSEKLKVPTYEIVRSTDNTSVNRRAAILACLNMTTTGNGSIIIVDEADNILNTQFSWFMRGETQDKGWLNHIMERPGARVIWITNHIDNIEKSVLRRFAYSLHFKPFNRRQRNRLWNNILRKNRVKRFFKQSDIESFAKKYIVSAGVIDLAIKKAIEAMPCSKQDFHQAVELALEAHIILDNSGEKPVNKNQIEKNYSLDGLNIHGDLQAIINQMEKFDQFLRKSDQNKIMNMNLLFYGSPGTGKSELARYIAEHLDREVIFKRYSDLQSMWVGVGEKNIKHAFAGAEAEDAVLVIDEADSFLSSRDRAVHSWEISFTNEFLTQMERFRGILICTTNRLKDLDSASIRRFNHKVEFNYLNTEGNVIFYKKFFSPMVNVRIDEKSLDEIKTISDLSPGDFKTVRDRYLFYPAGDLNHKVLIQALEEEARIKNIHKGNKRIGF